MAICGKCKEKGVTVDHVRRCFEVDAPVPQGEVGELHLVDLGGSEEPSGGFFGGNVFEDAWPEDPDKPKEQPKEQGHRFPIKEKRELEDGIYKLGSDYFMVYHTVHGANQQVAKKLIVPEDQDRTVRIGNDEEEGPKGEWVYMGKSPLKHLSPIDKLDDEAAQDFGQVYGWCGKCGRPLTNELSKKIGIGPKCRGAM